MGVAVLLVALWVEHSIQVGQCLNFDEKCNIVDSGVPCGGPVSHPECMGSPNPYLLCGHHLCAETK